MGSETVEAECPDCRGWYPVEVITVDGVSGYWWTDPGGKHGGGCPGCGGVVLVESECTFRGPDEARAARSIHDAIGLLIGGDDGT